MSRRLSAGWGGRKNLRGGRPGPLQSLVVVAPNVCYKDILLPLPLQYSITPIFQYSNTPWRPGRPPCNASFLHYSRIPRIYPPFI